MSHKQKNHNIILRRIIRIWIVLCLSALTFIYFQFTLGAAGIGIWVQALPVFLATLALIIGVYRVAHNKPALALLFWGTLPAWLIHIPITIMSDSESPIFVIATGIVPLVAGILWVIHVGNNTNKTDE